MIAERPTGPDSIRAFATAPTWPGRIWTIANRSTLVRDKQAYRDDYAAGYRAGYESVFHRR
jgi:hypothetical protein